jgi:hypothetical protein
MKLLPLLCFQVKFTHASLATFIQLRLPLSSSTIEPLLLLIIILYKYLDFFILRLQSVVVQTIHNDLEMSRCIGDW